MNAEQRAKHIAAGLKWTNDNYAYWLLQKRALSAREPYKGYKWFVSILVISARTLECRLARRSGLNTPIERSSMRPLHLWQMEGEIIDHDELQLLIAYFPSLGLPLANIADPGID